MFGAALLMACDTVPKAHAATVQLVQTTLPKKLDEGVEHMQFAPDGARILIRGAKAVELVATHSLESVAAFKTEGKWSDRWARYLDTGAVAFGAMPVPEFLLPDLTRRPLPADTEAVSADGRYVFTHARSSATAPDAIRETAGGRMVCDLGVSSVDRRSDIRNRYAVAGQRSTIVLCELASGKVSRLGDGEGVTYATGVLDPQERWLLVNWRRSSGDKINAETSTALYRLPLTADHAPSGTDTGTNQIDAKPVRRWEWHDQVRSGFSPDGKWLMMRAGETLQLVRLDALTDTVTIRTGKSNAAPVFSRDGHWLALQDEVAVYLVDLRAKPHSVKLKPPAPVKDFTLYDIAPDGSALLATVRTMQDDVERVVWRIEAGAK